MNDQPNQGELELPSEDDGTENNMAIEANTELYTTGGTIAGEGKLYVERQADDQLYDNCRSGQLSYVLTARQMGKSSLMVQTRKRLQAAGYRTVVADLTSGIAGNNVGARQFYFALLTRLADELELDIEIDEWWDKWEGKFSPALLFNNFIRDEVLSQVDKPVVMFIDEIDAIRSMKRQSMKKQGDRFVDDHFVDDHFVDDFFAAIRSMYNERATNNLYKRITFVLLGVARPNELINDPERTPFNIGVGIHLSYFSEQEAMVLAKGMGLSRSDANKVIGWVRDWTEGHPYLTQKMCAAIAENPTHFQNQASVDRLIDQLFLKPSEPDSNIRFVTDWMTRPAEAFVVLKLYYRVLSSIGLSPVRSDEGIWVDYLKLGGVLQEDNGNLRISNRLYRTYFDRTWLSDQLRVKSLITIEELEQVIREEDREAEEELHRRRQREQEQKQELDWLADEQPSRETEFDWLQHSDDTDDAPAPVTGVTDVADDDSPLEIEAGTGEQPVSEQELLEQVPELPPIDELLKEIGKFDGPKTPGSEEEESLLFDQQSRTSSTNSFAESTPLPSIPRAPTYSVETATTRAERQHVDTIRILLVDDIPETRINFRKILAFEQDLEVVGMASNGREAVTLTESLRPHVVLMDILMPDMDGITATSIITDRFPDVGVCMCSVRSDSDQIRRSMLAGARDFLSKPVSPDDLYATIHTVHASLATVRERVRNMNAITQSYVENLANLDDDQSKKDESTVISNTIRILLVDDNVEARTEMGKLLAFEPRFEVVGTAGDVEEATKLTRELEPDVVLLDIPNMDGFEATRIIRRQMPNCAVIIASVQDGIDYYRQAMQAGASYYLEQPVTAEELYEAVERVYSKWEPIRSLHAAEALFDETTVEHVPDLEVVLRFPETAKEIYAAIYNSNVLTVNEEAVLSSINQSTTIRQIADKNDITDTEIRHIVYDFVQVGLVEIAKPTDEKSADKSSWLTRIRRLITSVGYIPFGIVFLISLGFIIFGPPEISYLGYSLGVAAILLAIVRRFWSASESGDTSSPGFDTLPDLERAMYAESATSEDEEDIDGRSSRVSLVHGLENLLQGFIFTQRLRIRLARAAVRVSAAEYLVVQITITVGAFLIAFVLFSGNIIASIVAGIVGWLVPDRYVALRVRERLSSFDEQLIDTIALWVNALRSGYSVLQSMEAMARDAPEPTATEFTRVVQEVQLGIPISTALDHMLERVESKDLDLLFTAVNIQREVGGNLAEILDVIGYTIRERIRASRTLQLRGLPIHRFIVGLVGIAIILQSTLVADYFARTEGTLSGQLALFMAYGLATIVLFFTGWVGQQRYRILGDQGTSWVGQFAGSDAWIALVILAFIVGVRASATYTIWFSLVVITTIVLRPQKILPFMVVGLISAIGYIVLSSSPDLLSIDWTAPQSSINGLVGVVAFVVLAFLVVLAGLFVFNKIRNRNRDLLESRLEQYIDSEPMPSLEEIELSLSFQERVINPLSQRLADFTTRFAPRKQLEVFRRKLDHAGKVNADPAILFLQRLINMLIFGVCFGFVGSYVNLIASVLAGICGAIVGFYLPLILLDNKIRIRRERIRDSLGDAVDLMVICIEAGLGFDSAMGKVYEKWDNDLAVAFGRVLREIQLGRLRRDALRNMASHMDVPDVTTFIAAVIQADQLGVSMGRILRVQSDQFRVKQRQRWESWIQRSQSRSTIALFTLALATTLWLIAPIMGAVLG